MFLNVFFIDFGLPIRIIVLVVLICFFSRIPYFIAYKKVEKQFDNGLEQKLANIIPSDVREIEFSQSCICYTHPADGKRHRCRFDRLGYEDLPKLRYAKVMAMIYQKRFLAGKNVKILPFYSDKDFHEVSAGYHTTKSYDGYHTVEKREIVESKREKLGYKLVNFDVARTDIVKTPTKKKW